VFGVGGVVVAGAVLALVMVLRPGLGGKTDAEQHSRGQHALANAHCRSPRGMIAPVQVGEDPRSGAALPHAGSMPAPVATRKCLLLGGIPMRPGAAATPPGARWRTRPRKRCSAATPAGAAARVAAPPPLAARPTRRRTAARPRRRGHDAFLSTAAPAPLGARRGQ